MGVGDAISAMEATETWAVTESQVVVRALTELSDRLNSAEKDVLTRSIHESSADVVDFMGFLKSGRALRLFRWLVDINPDLAGSLVQSARDSGNDFGIILIERMRVLERQHLLSRVFSPERLALVSEILSEVGVAGVDEEIY